MEHELKTWSEQFHAVRSGRKTFEFRYNDRDYNVGDILVLREYNPVIKTYSGRMERVQVMYILRGGFGIPENYVIMSIKKMS